MAGVLEERYGVAISGVSWDAGPFKLWAAQSPGVILFSPKQPTLAKSLTTGRYEAACAQYRAQQDNTYKIVGGAASFTLTTAVQYDEGQMQALKEQWRQLVAGSPDVTANPVFIPLNTRKGTTQLAVPMSAGTPSKVTQDANDAGTAGGTLTYMVDLTSQGAQEWGDAIRAGKSPIAQVMLQYEYMRYMPQCSVQIIIHGDRVFQHFSGQLKASYDGWLYGGSVDLQAQFESLRADNSIEMHFTGLDDLPSGFEKLKENLIQTVTDQGLKAVLGMLFRPKPDIKPAEAGNAGGWFGGANLALKWRREEEAVDLRTNLEFGGFTWLTERADADLSVFAVLDDSYVTTVNTELQFPATVTVVGDPQVTTTAVSWTASEGQAPQSPVFTNQGGTQTYVVTSRTPDAVTISYSAKIDYQPPQWPIVTTSGNGSVRAGFDSILIKPSQWLGSTTIYLYVKDDLGKGIKLIGAQQATADYLVVNVSYAAPNLDQPIKASTKLTLDTPVTFSYPLDPNGRPGTAKFSAFGIIGGQLVHAPEQPIGLDESAVFVLVQGGKIQLVSSNAVLNETDTTAQELLRRRDTVVITGDRPATSTQPGKVSETTKGGAAATGYDGHDGHVRGMLVGVAYDEAGGALLIDTGGDGQPRRVPLADVSIASRFRERETVVVTLNSKGQAAQVLVELRT